MRKVIGYAIDAERFLRFFRQHDQQVLIGVCERIEAFDPWAGTKLVDAWESNRLTGSEKQLDVGTVEREGIRRLREWKDHAILIAEKITRGDISIRDAQVKSAGGHITTFLKGLSKKTVDQGGIFENSIWTRVVSTFTRYAEIEGESAYELVSDAEDISAFMASLLLKKN
ncbi:MAG: hypothetical protein AAB855_00225, partial [Patescibacteria group bacterium]